MAFRFQPPDEGDDLGPPPGPFRFRPRRRWRLPGGVLRWAIPVVSLILLFIVASIAKDIYADWLWFDSVGYRSVYRLRIVTRIWLFFAGGGVFLLFFGLNVLVALRASGGFSFNLGGDQPVPSGRVVLVLGLASAIFLAVIFGVQAAGQWDDILLFMNGASFGQEDPLFHQDIGFYVFRLPALNFIVAWSLGAVIVTTVIVVALYAARLALGGFGEAPALARPHVSLLVVAVIGLFVWRYWLGRYGLVYSDRGAAFGAGYADVHAQLPAIYALMGFAAFAALCVLVSGFRRGLLALPVAATALWVVAAIAGGIIYPATVQRFQVEPNELAREREYIQRNIDATRAAYGLDRIEERPFPARASVTAEEILGNQETIQNVRLWDARPLLQTLNQIQTIRPLYDFVDVDIDRYVIDGDLRQVAIAPRELNPGRLPEDAQSWVNRRLQFTHGFGVAVVPVNEVVEEGLPAFFVKDIPPSGEIEIAEPRLYYGEMPDHYVVVNSDEEEFDYPVGEDRTTTVFEGGGGVRLSSFWRRLVYSWEFTDTNLLISDALNDESRVLYRRNLRERIHEIAPFLRLDADPYLVVADGRLVWVQDAYTHTGRYPYATREGDLNYVRNSVKVSVDAYDGAVTFYLVEPDDPIARAYAGIYPDLFTPFDEMPDALRAHLRYPEDLFSLQARLYLRYHIRDATVFFNREDLWDIPTELFVDREQPVEPYYVIMRLPGESQAEFVLIMPFRPANRNNTIAWLAARSDGEQYGKLLTFRFPTETLVFGPSQVESRVDQDTLISQQISLWNQSGSQVIRGNLLMIPIGEGNLFVEPIYLQATASSLPELKRVVVVNGNRIAMEPTLERALQVVLGLAEPTGPTEEPDGGPTPGPSPTPPTPGATPLPTATPPPTATPGPTVELPDDVDALIREANDTFERAQQLLRQGDFAGYAQEIERLGEILRALAGAVGP
jgi:hypothetical protein